MVDFHRGVIQHKRFLTLICAVNLQERELDKHIGYGRVYRIVPDDYKPAAKPADLVAGLSHEHLWWRLRSQQRIVEGKRLDLVDLHSSASDEQRGKSYAGCMRCGPWKVLAN